MNFLAKAAMTLLTVALGIVPAVVLHADPLQAAGAEHAEPSGSLAEPPEATESPDRDVIEPDPSRDAAAPVDILEPEEPSWRDWTGDASEGDDDDRDDRRRDREDAAEEDPVDATPGECSYWNRAGCGPGDGYGRTEPDSPDPGESTAESTEPEPEPTEPAEDDGGLLGDLLGG